MTHENHASRLEEIIEIAGGLANARNMHYRYRALVLELAREGAAARDRDQLKKSTDADPLGPTVVTRQVGPLSALTAERGRLARSARVGGNEVHFARPRPISPSGMAELPDLCTSRFSITFQQFGRKLLTEASHLVQSVRVNGDGSMLLTMVETVTGLARSATSFLCIGSTPTTVMFSRYDVAGNVVQTTAQEMKLDRGDVVAVYDASTRVTYEMLLRPVLE